MKLTDGVKSSTLRQLLRLDLMSKHEYWPLEVSNNYTTVYVSFFACMHAGSEEQLAIAWLSLVHLIAFYYTLLGVVKYNVSELSLC